MMQNKYIFETFSSDQMSFDQEFTKYLNERRKRRLESQGLLVSSRRRQPDYGLLSLQNEGLTTKPRPKGRGSLHISWSLTYNPYSVHPSL